MIHNKAMLVRLSISQWTARKHDRNVSSEIEKAHAAHNAGRFNKLLVDKENLDPITKLATTIRQYHYTMTLPWGDDHSRLLPSQLFVQYTGKMREFKDDFRKLVLAFAAEYPNMVAEARKRLGTMYDPTDYPSIDSIAARFDINTEFLPIPDAQDFRVEVSKEAEEQIRASITQSVSVRLEEAIGSCFDRAREVCSNMYERLSDPEAKFRDTLVTNIESLVAVLPSLNVTQSKNLTLVINRMRGLLIDPDVLRNNPQIRANTAQLAADIARYINLST